MLVAHLTNKQCWHCRFLLVFFTSSSILGQDKLINPSLIQSNNNNSIDLERCGTPDPTAKQYAYTRDVIATYSLNENSGLTAIPIRSVTLILFEFNTFFT